jgi:nucleoside phosphorylase
LFEIYVRDPKLPGKREPQLERGAKLFYGYVSEEGTYEAEITRPILFESYLCRQIKHLLTNHAPVIRVRLSRRKMPLHFAIEAWEQGELNGDGVFRGPEQTFCEFTDDVEIATSLNKLLPELSANFYVPDLEDIPDVAKIRETEVITVPSLRFVNEILFRPAAAEPHKWTDLCAQLQAELSGADNIENTAESVLKRILGAEIAEKAEQLRVRREYKIVPLSLFNADRIDFSLGRIRHYTKTLPEHFQNFVILTNYQMYADRFLVYCVCRLLQRCMEEGTVPITPAEQECLTRAKQAYLSRSKKVTDQIVPPRDPDAEIFEPSIPMGDLSVIVPIDDPLKSDVELTAATVAQILCKDLSNWNIPAKDDLKRAWVLALARALYPDHQPKEMNRLEISDIKEQDASLLALTREIFENFLEKKVRDGVLGPEAPQMPAYHLIHKSNGSNTCGGISLVNIGVGPSNAKNITDHLAVLRPVLFLMLGHCAGLRSTQDRGHFILANGYLRADRILDDYIRPDVPIPPITEVQHALIAAFNVFTGLNVPLNGDPDVSSSPRIRMGTVATVLDRNWEFGYPNEIVWPIQDAKCIGLEMESATVAANGCRLSVPYATFLCVSDRPLHGDLKLPGMAKTFYTTYIREHFDIAIQAVEALIRCYPNGIPTRKLRAPNQPAFQ